MFALSRRFGALADRYGPRLFMGGGPADRRRRHPAAPRTGHRRRRTSPTCCRRCSSSRSGSSMTVAPLTATVLADADESDAGIASAINNAIARVAGLIGISVVGVVVAGTLVGDTFARNAESVHAFHVAIVICAALVAAGGVAGAIGIVNPRRAVDAEGCPGGQLVGAPQLPQEAQSSVDRAAVEAAQADRQQHGVRAEETRTQIQGRCGGRSGERGRASARSRRSSGSGRDDLEPSQLVERRPRVLAAAREQKRREDEREDEADPLRLDERADQRARVRRRRARRARARRGTSRVAPTARGSGRGSSSRSGS